MIVSTSVLELAIDVGDLDHMIQIVSDGGPPEWSMRAQQRLAELRVEYRDAGAGSSALVPDEYGLRMWSSGETRGRSWSPSFSPRCSPTMPLPER